jgi:hypothetical protein
LKLANCLGKVDQSIVRVLKNKAAKTEGCLQSFHRRLRHIREAGRLSVADVAELCGVDEEAELLRRFRKTTDDNRRMVLQLLGR